MVPIVVLIKASGSDLGSLFISRSRNWVVPAIGLIGLLTDSRSSTATTRRAVASSAAPPSTG
ncbi:MAG: hypothetical protein DLM58_08165 [Pseudonocardiales bacterium]|nr:MAG: hypothetical protein DLM58_08165 [Pseudonocardiales bacterium]